MQNMNLWLIIIGMAIVTYIPRMLPMVLLQEIKLPPLIKRFLELIPFAALSALIFPGILSSTGSTTSAVIGGIIAVLLAFFRLNLIVVVVGSILSVFCWEILLV